MADPVTLLAISVVALGLAIVVLTLALMRNAARLDKVEEQAHRRILRAELPKKRGGTGPGVPGRPDPRSDR